MGTHADASEYRTVAEVAAEVRRAPAWVREAIQRGELPAVRTGPRGRYLIHADDVRLLLAPARRPR